MNDICILEMSKEMIRVLYVDDEVVNLENFEFLFQDEYEIFTATSVKEGFEILKSNEIQIVISDQRMPETTGIQFLADISKLYPSIIRILLTAYTDTKDILDAINIGKVFQYITKPFKEQLVLDILGKASEIWHLKNDNKKLIEQLKLQNVEYEQINEELLQTNEELQKAKERAEESEHNLQLKNEEYEVLNEELRQTNEQLVVAKEKAEDNNRLKTQFLLNMSHEIRTPMNAIVGFSEMLNEPDVTVDKRKKYTSIIINSSNQLQSIVNNILTISSLETKQEKTKIEKVCINQILNDLYAIFNLQLQSQQLSLQLTTALTSEESEINTDNTKIQQILTNLLSNAAKFTHEGGIEFGYKLIDSTTLLSTHKQEVSDNSLNLLFFVKDSGIGITQEMQEKIFERFVQVESGLVRQYGGNGLGLSISKGFVELLGGKIWLESEPSKGSTFYFTIPYNPVNNAVIENKTPIQKERSKTILIADDELINFMFIKEVLNKMNFMFLHAKNGSEAVEICKSNSEIGLVLMDIKMPVMDGHTATKYIKSLNNNIVVVGQSAYTQEQYQSEYTENVFDDYLHKPLNISTLKQIVTKYLDSPKN